LAYPLIIQKELIGVIEVLNKKEGAFLKEDLEVVSLIAPQASIALKNAFLYNELEELFKGTIKSLATAVESKDPYTYDHIDRVTELSLKLAQKAGLGRKDLKNVELSAILHDIGKIAIPDEILNKPGKLTDEEYEIIKTHVYHGAKILEPIPGLKEVVPAVLHHHERWDGKGYPYGLKGEKIPVIARIITITDAFDAMSSDRVYRKALPGHEIFKEFNKEKGKQFDPELTRLFLELEEVNTVLNKLENK
jgi:putative nucleotidyltransferase with HDIG domain